MSMKKPTREQMKCITKMGLDSTAYFVYHWPSDGTPIVLVNRYTGEKIQQLLPANTK